MDRTDTCHICRHWSYMTDMTALTLPAKGVENSIKEK